MKLLREHPTAVIVGVVGAALYVTCGLLFAHAEHVPAWHGLYCAAANAMTEGDCDVAPTTPLAYIVNTIEHLALVAIAAAVLAVFTSRLSSALVKSHVEDAAEAIKRHTDARLRHHLGNSAGGGTQAEGEPPK